jgi:hypothetical protein
VYCSDSKKASMSQSEAQSQVFIGSQSNPAFSDNRTATAAAIQLQAMMSASPIQCKLLGAMQLNQGIAGESEAGAHQAEHSPDKGTMYASLPEVNPPATGVIQGYLWKDPEHTQRYAKTYKYTRSRHKNIFKTTAYFDEVESMYYDDSDHAMTVKEAYESCKKPSKTKPQSQSSKMKNTMDINDFDPNRLKYSYSLQGGPTYEETETIGKRKRKRVSSTSGITLQDDSRNNAGIEKSDRVTHMHYPNPGDIFTRTSKIAEPYAAAHRTPSFFDFRAGMNQGDDYRNVDETSTSHNKRHSSHEAGIRKKLKAKRAKGEDITNLRYEVETEHEKMNDPGDFATKVHSSLDLAISKERLEKFYIKRRKINPDAEHISSDKRTLFDGSNQILGETDIGADYEKDLPPKFMSQSERDFENFRRARYHGATSSMIIESDSEDSELDDEPPVKGSRLADARRAKKMELENIVQKLRDQNKKGRLNDNGKIQLAEFEDQLAKFK